MLKVTQGVGGKMGIELRLPESQDKDSVVLLPLS